MNLQKTPPYRSPAFLAFCHEEMPVITCRLCEKVFWKELHHFGDDGGGALKPSDNEVARVCLRCHGKYGLKRKALLKIGTPKALDALDRYQNDALKLCRAYMEKLEKK